MNETMEEVRIVLNTNTFSFFRLFPTKCQGRPRPLALGASEHAYFTFFQYTFDSHICCAPADSLEKKSEFVSGKHIFSVVPESLRQVWKRQWFERGVDGRSGAEQRLD